MATRKRTSKKRKRQNQRDYGSQQLLSIAKALNFAGKKDQARGLVKESKRIYNTPEKTFAEKRADRNRQAMINAANNLAARSADAQVRGNTKKGEDLANQAQRLIYSVNGAPNEKVRELSQSQDAELKANYDVFGRARASYDAGTQSQTDRNKATERTRNAVEQIEQNEARQKQREYGAQQVASIERAVDRSRSRGSGRISQPALPAQTKPVQSPFTQGFSTLGASTNSRSLSTGSQSAFATPAGSSATGGVSTGAGDSLIVGQRMSENPVLANLLEQYSADAQRRVDPAKIKREAIRDANAQVRAINAVRNDLLNAQKRENRQRVGTERAQSARAGLLGSDFGTASAENVLDYNRQLDQTINNTYDAKVQTIFADARNFAQTEISRLDALKQQGAEGYLEAIEREEEILDNGLKNTVNAMIARGIDPLELSEKELSQVASNFGATPDKVLSFYQQAVGGVDDEPKGFSLGKDQTRYEYNPQTGQYEAVGFGSDVNASGNLAPEDIKALQNTLDTANNSLSALSQIATNPALQQTALGRKIGRITWNENALDLEASLNTLKANLSFGALQAMRDASKTGGALGQVSEQEIELLGSTVASLTTKQGPEQLIENLRIVEDTFRRMKEGAEADLYSIPTLSEGSDTEWEW